MADEISNVRVDVGELSKPINTFIKKMASAANLLYAPTHTRRMAKANAEAALIEAKAELEVADLKRRATSRVLLEEMRNQANMESIAGEAIPLLTDKADASKVDDDWMANFFANCRNISNDEMQQLWAKLLAGEVNNPGAFSKRVVNILADMDTSDAELFRKLCSFSIWFGNVLIPLIYFKSSQTGVGYSPAIYANNELPEHALRHLDTIGLINRQ